MRDPPSCRTVAAPAPQGQSPKPRPPGHVRKQHVPSLKHMRQPQPREQTHRTPRGAPRSPWEDLPDALVAEVVRRLAPEDLRWAHGAEGEGGRGRGCTLPKKQSKRVITKHEGMHGCLCPEGCGGILEISQVEAGRAGEPGEGMLLRD